MGEAKPLRNLLKIESKRHFKAKENFDQIKSTAPTCVNNHNWKETNKISPHVGAESVVYLLCETCGQSGFRRPPSRVVYTWLKEKNEKNLKK